MAEKNEMGYRSALKEKEPRQKLRLFFQLVIVHLSGENQAAVGKLGPCVAFRIVFSDSMLRINFSFDWLPDII